MRRTLTVILIVAATAAFAAPAGAKVSPACSSALVAADRMIGVWDQEALNSAQYETALVVGDRAGMAKAVAALKLIPIRASRDAYKAAAKRCRNEK